MSRQGGSGSGENGTPVKSHEMVSLLRDPEDGRAGGGGGGRGGAGASLSPGRLRPVRTDADWSLSQAEREARWIEDAADMASAMLKGQFEGGIAKNMQVVFALVAFAAVSSLLLVLNAATLHNIPSPCLLLIGQLVTSAAAGLAIDDVGLALSYEVDWAKVSSFSPAAVLFGVTLYSGLKVLQHSTLETFLAVRSGMPLVVAILEAIFLGRELPNPKSLLCTLAIIAGFVSYGLLEGGLVLGGQLWIPVYVVVFLVDQLYIKHTVEGSYMTTWSRVFYANIIALIPVMVLGLVFDISHVGELRFTASAVGFLAATCILGIAMCYLSFLLRVLLCAATFTTVGAVSKFLAVLFGIVILGKSTSWLGLLLLGLCTAAGTFYQQAPRRL